MSKRVYTARNHPAMPKDPAKSVRLALDFPSIDAMLEFKDLLNRLNEEKLKLHAYKLDMFDLEQIPMGNHYYLTVPSNDQKGRTEITKDIIKVQRTKYDRKTK